MEALIFGDGNLGRAIASALIERGDASPTVVGRPGRGGHDPADLPAADVAFEATRAPAVRGNVAAAVAAGCRRFVIATTGWEADRDAVETALRAGGAAAVAAPNLSLGVVVFCRLVEQATAWLGAFEDVDPYVLEWHRRSKADRPSGTARDLARRILATHPRKRRVVEPGSGRSPEVDELELVVLRAGASPGMHLVGFDAPGETLELRLTARDRSAYAAGAIVAADWLSSEPRRAGIHELDEVLAEVLPERLNLLHPERSRAVAGH